MCHSTTLCQNLRQGPRTGKNTLDLTRQQLEDQADLKASRLPAAVAQLFHGGSKPSKPSEQKPKRRRM